MRQVVCTVFALVALGLLSECELNASQFTIDSTQSFLTISGSTATINGEQAIEPQSLGSLTDYFSGRVLVDLQTPGELQIIGSSINGIPNAGSFSPLGTPADFAGQIPEVLQAGSTAFIAIRQSFGYQTSSPVPIDPSGQFDGSAVRLRLESRNVGISAPPFSPFTTNLNLEMANLSFSPASLTAVGDQYQIVIPFAGTAQANFGQVVNFNVAGQFVATRPIQGATDPDILDGGFENHYAGPGGTSSGPTAWHEILPGTSNNVAGYPIYGFASQRPLASEGLQHAFINVENGTASIYQTIIPAGALKADSIYRVTFDVGNRDLTDNGNLPNNDMDPFISVKGFFSLGNSLDDFALHVGDAYFLAKLSDIPDGTWSQDNVILLDTSKLTPQQLTEPLHIVLQATSTTTSNRGQVNFDDVRLEVVPEPSTYALVTMGIISLVAYRRLRRDRFYACPWRRFAID